MFQHVWEHNEVRDLGSWLSVVPGIRPNLKQSSNFSCDKTFWIFSEKFVPYDQSSSLLILEPQKDA
jgi:hypothetical protein